MRKNALLHTNLVICLIITVGFVATSIIGYRSNTGIFKKDIEHVSTLAAEGIYYQIDKILSEPVNVSLAMANDNLLKTFLAQEQQKLDDQAYIQELGDYLHAYRQKYLYDSVFLVSAETNRYYHFKGLDRVLTPGNPENTWYYEFIKSEDEYSLNIDNDEASDNSITAFVNCKIKDADGKLLGVIGVGLRVRTLQQLLRTYDEKFEVQAYLIDQTGIVQLASDQTGFEQVNLLEKREMTQQQDKLLSSEAEQQTFWRSSEDTTCFVVSQYVPSLKWHLVIENDMTAMSRQLQRQFMQGMLIIALILVLVLFIISSVLQHYKRQILKLSMSQKQEYQRLLGKVTEGIYENIFEINITRNCTGTDDPNRYFNNFGITLATPYDEALRIVARRQIQPEYAQGYLDLFAPERVLACHKSGITNLSYDFPATCDDGESYYWIRITARIFYWASDESVRMISYRQNIDLEKKQELYLIEKSQLDSLTGLYNKRTAEEMMTETLKQAQDSERVYALLMCDIDNFKNVNDQCGHTFGDTVIAEFAAELKSQFRDSDIVGRVGGDEFAALLFDCDDICILQKKLGLFCERITHKDFGQEKGQSISCSIGVALYPTHGQTYVALSDRADHALYYAKAHGKGQFHITGVDAEDGGAAHMNVRSLRDLLENATDGIAKFACTTPLTVLYFNQKMSELVGRTPQEISDPNFDPMSTIHPDDLKMVQQTLQEMLTHRKAASVSLNVLRNDNTYVFVKLQTMFVNELYKDQYPVFYAAYTDLSDIIPPRHD